MMTTLRGVTLEAAALVDTACAKSVAGMDGANTMMRLCVERDIPCEKVADHEPFRFGPGKGLYSCFALIVTVVLGIGFNRISYFGCREESLLFAQQVPSEKVRIID